MKIGKLAQMAAATVAGAITLPASAHADTPQLFLSPSGDIVCGVGTGNDGKSSATCEVRDFTWTLPQQCNMGSSNEFNLTQGNAPEPRCHTDTNFVAGLPTLPYGQTRSAGPITCDSETSGVTCTDSGTGHFFQVSRESYQLG